VLSRAVRRLLKRRAIEVIAPLQGNMSTLTPEIKFHYRIGPSRNCISEKFRTIVLEHWNKELLPCHRARLSYDVSLEKVVTPSTTSAPRSSMLFVF
jgi:hypothetical protein